MTATFSLNHRRLIGALAVFFVMAVALGIHGFSLPLFHDIIDGSQSTELWAGAYKWIRGDEWAMTVPTALAQLSHDPKFPVVNQNIGLGQNMLVYPQMPVADFFTLFRPSLWGYFIGPDTGLAWQWWSRVLGLLYGFFLLFMAVSENQFRLSLLGSVAFLFSPFIQFWSFNAAEMLVSMAVSVVLAASLLSTARPGWDWAVRSVALWWLGGVFALGFYPAFQIPLVYTALGLVASLVWLRYQRQGRPANAARRFAGLLGVALAILSTAGLFYLQTAEAVEIMRHTAYPGLRHETGGGQSGVLFFSNFVHFFDHGKVLRVLGNICEAGSFLFFFPLCVLAALASLPFGRNPRLVTLLPLCGTLGFLLFWMFVGLPEPLPSWTLLKHVPPYRATVAIGVVNAVLIVAYLSETYRVEAPSWAKRTLYGFWCVFLLAMGRALHFRIPELPLYVVYWSFLVMAVVSGFILFRHRMAAVAWIVPSVAMTLPFNPVVRGGTQFIVDNPLSREMIALDRKAEGRSRWLVYGGQQLGNLPRMLGLKSLSGQHFYTQWELWKSLDPEGKSANIYNRYAQTEWRVEGGPAARFDVVPPAIVIVYVNPKHEALRRMQVDYFLVEGDDSFFRAEPQTFEPLFHYANKHIFGRR